MKNLFNNLKISTSILIMSIFSMVFILLISTLSFLSVNTLDNNMNSMYENNLQTIARFGNIRGNFLNIRIGAATTLINYDLSTESRIKSYAETINNQLAEYKSSRLTKYEEDILSQFESYYSKYMNTWNTVSPKLKNKGKITKEESDSLSTYGSLAEQKLVSLRNYNENSAGDVSKKSDNIYENIIKFMIIISSLSIIISFSLSFIIIQTIKKSSKEMINSMDLVSQGDFSVKIDSNSKNEFGIMKKSLSKTLESISNMIKIIKEKSISIDSHSENLSSISEEMASSSENVTAAISEIATGTGSQTDELVNITGILNKFSNKLDAIVNSIKSVDVDSKGIHKIANESNNDMQKLIDSINKVGISFKNFIIKISNLGEDIHKINEITNFINNISEQTNLLALNAAIEAARAGESGRGFSVVADEIRKLAEQSKASSENINVLIREISSNSNSILKTTDEMNNEFQGESDIINTALASFKHIISSINAIIPRIEEINSSALSINNDKNLISEKIEEASSIAEEVSASSQEISASSEEMSSSSEEVAASAQGLMDATKEMVLEVNKFKLK